MSTVKSNYSPCTFPAIQNYGYPHRLGVPKFGREPPSMWGNPFYPGETFQQKKPEVTVADSSRMKIKRTSTPKISNESIPSPILSGKKRSESLVQTVLKDTDILQKALNENNQTYWMFAKIQNCRNDEERLDFIDRYQATYQEDLEDRLLKDIPNEVSDLTQSLFQKSENIIIHSLYNAVKKGTGAIGLALIEILFLSSCEEIQRYTQLYPQLYPGSNLQEDIENNTDSNVEKLCLALLQNQRKETETVDIERAKTDAKELIEASKSDRADKIIEIVATNCIAQLSRFIHEFYQINNEKLSAFVSNGIPKKHRFGDLFQPCLKLIISLVEDRVRCKAGQLTQAIKYLSSVLNSNQGLDVTRHKQVVHRMFIVDREEMKEICEKIEELEGKTLGSFIETLQQVEYKNMLLTFVRDNEW